MDVIHGCCAGLDVHKRTVHACVRRVSAGGQVRKESRGFETTTRELLALGDWLAAEGVTHVAMESTGVFWKPIWNLLEDRFELLLCNAQHMKQVPGRKTDVKDSEWVAQLLQYGLLQASFVPPPPLRELRELTRQRVQWTHDRTATINRIQKILEDANVKLASVASDVVGVSGRLMLRALIRGESAPEEMAQLARGRLIKKIPALEVALEGRVTEHHRFLLGLLLEQLERLEEMIGRLDDRIVEVMESDSLNAGSDEEEEGAPLPFPVAVALLTTMPGVDRRTAEYVLAEIGTDMSRFPTAGHLASWAGLCPGNHRSAGKRKSGRTTKGNRWLRRALTQAAWAASHTKGTYLSAFFRRLAGRRGKKRAIVAVAHSMLTAAYAMLKNHAPYHDLGAQHFDQRKPEQLKRRLVKRLEGLGYQVELAPLEDAA